ncbi:MAG: hypothetical protein FWC71_10650 [Defluviitaleaceae bacterium]|nr:hypothetical protein [Defluviitaleaceae bacterium]
MNCNCTNGCHQCGHEPVRRQVFNCPGSQRVIRHEHVVKHRHDIINEYDVIHEHEFNTRDVVRERKEVCHNDFTTHQPNYCGEDCDRGQPMIPRPRFWSGRRW